MLNLKIFRLALFCGCALLLTAQAPAQTSIIKSPNDPRAYEYFRLHNGLQVVVVSDPKTDKAAASLSVNAGSRHDPLQREGLAHFLEHMLFLGTEKYPQADDYQAFISARGGSHNAYTAHEETNYHFDIEKDHLAAALDRFSQFFISPLFSSEYVMREKNAVHSEYQARIQDDVRRGYSVMQQVINPAHPQSHFAVGSLDTLADRPNAAVRDELLKFYRQYYSADRMTLVVLGQEPVAQLKAWVEEYFAAIKKLPPIAGTATPPLFADGQLPAKLDFVPLKDERELQLLFPMPSNLGLHQQKPMNYIGNLLGHEGPGSLLSLLKKQGWADGLSVGTVIDNTTESAFAVSINLTEAGFQYTEAIIDLCFSAIDLIRRQGIEQWRYDEQTRLAELNFTFQEGADPEDLVTAIATTLHVVEAENVLRAAGMMTTFDADLIRQRLDLLTRERMLEIRIAKDLPTDQVDPWYQAAYSIAAVTETPRASAHPLAGQLTLPAANPFIAERTSIKPRSADATPVPHRLANGPTQKNSVELWFKQDDTFKLPLADFYFSVRSPVANDTPRHAVLTTLYTRVVTDNLNEYAYPALLAGLSYQLYPHLRGFSVRLSGYDDKQALLLEAIIHSLRAPQIDDTRFAALKDTLMRELQNSTRDNPYDQAINEVSDVLVRPHWNENERIDALQGLQAQDLRAFIPPLLSKIDVVALAHGNLTAPEAQSLAGLLEQGIAHPAQAARMPGGRVLQIPSGKHYVRQLQIDHPDAVLADYVQGINQSARSHAQIELLTQIIAPQYYHQLRTEKQLGYIVATYTLPLLDVPGLIFIAQSPVADVARLRQETEQFIVQLRAKLAAMPDEEFTRQQQGVIAEILEQDDKLKTRSDRYWKELDIQQYRFDTKQQIAAAVQKMSQADLLAAYDNVLSAAKRKQLSVTHPNPAAGQSPDAQTEQVTDPHEFAKHQPYYQPAQGLNIQPTR